MSRKYTGNSDGAAKGRRAGLKVLIDEVVRLSQSGLWNNGDFGIRNMKGKESLSVHATGRACDLSYRQMGKGKGGGRAAGMQWCKLLTQHADAIGLEMIIDYFPEPHGRAWRCDRGAWQKYDKPTVSGAPSGDWLHVEVSPKMADDAAAMKAAFALIEQSLAAQAGG
jgi:hypothetical protein